MRNFPAAIRRTLRSLDPRSVSVHGARDRAHLGDGCLLGLILNQRALRPYHETEGHVAAEVSAAPGLIALSCRHSIPKPVPLQFGERAEHREKELRHVVAADDIAPEFDQVKLDTTLLKFAHDPESVICVSERTIQLCTDDLIAGFEERQEARPLFTFGKRNRAPIQNLTAINRMAADMVSESVTLPDGTVVPAALILAALPLFFDRWAEEDAATGGAGASFGSWVEEVFAGARHRISPRVSPTPLAPRQYERNQTLRPDFRAWRGLRESNPSSQRERLVS